MGFLTKLPTRAGRIIAVCFIAVLLVQSCLSFTNKELVDYELSTLQGIMFLRSPNAFLTGSEADMPIWVDGKLAGMLVYRKYLFLPLSPGEHYVELMSRGDLAMFGPHPRTVTIEPGKILLVNPSAAPSWGPQSTYWPSNSSQKGYFQQATSPEDEAKCLDEMKKLSASRVFDLVVFKARLLGERSGPVKKSRR